MIHRNDCLRDAARPRGSDQKPALSSVSCETSSLGSPPTSSFFFPPLTKFGHGRKIWHVHGLRNSCGKSPRAFSSFVVLHQKLLHLLFSRSEYVHAMAWRKADCNKHIEISTSPAATSTSPCVLPIQMQSRVSTCVALQSTGNVIDWLDDEYEMHCLPGSAIASRMAAAGQQWLP